MPVRAIELDKVPKIQQLSNFIIKQVEDNEQLLAWAHVVATGFGLPEEVCAPFIDLELSLGILPQSSARRYLGYQNEIPVSTSELVFDAGVAGIYAVTTLPEARRQGFGASMTSFPLHEALANGYKIGTLQASSMGHPVYRKLGFHDVYNFEIYEWPGSQAVISHEELDRSS
jgi:GNAT superfamily N-acetyltransferase